MRLLTCRADVAPPRASVVRLIVVQAQGIRDILGVGAPEVVDACRRRRQHAELGSVRLELESQAVDQLVLRDNPQAMRAVVLDEAGSMAADLSLVPERRIRSVPTNQKSHFVAVFCLTFRTSRESFAPPPFVVVDEVEGEGFELSDEVFQLAGVVEPRLVVA